MNTLTVLGDTGLRKPLRPLALGIAFVLTAAEAGAPLTSHAQERAPVRSRIVADQPAASPAGTFHRIGTSSAGNYLAGRFAQKARDFRAAARLLSNALGSDPQNPDLLRRAFFTSLASGQVDAARRLARRTAAFGKPAPLADLVLVVEKLREGAFDEAERMLGATSGRGFSAFLVPLLSAWAQAGQDRPDDALKTLAGLKETAGFAVIGDYHSALILDLAERTEEAERHYLAAVSGAPRPTVRLIEAIGSFYERTGRPGEAEKRYRDFLDQQGASPLLEHALAQVSSGAPGRIVADAGQGAAEVLFNVSGTPLQENSIGIALICGHLALHLRPRFPLARVLVGRMLESVGRAEEAIAVYDSVDRASPLWWSARLRRADGLEVLGRQEEAVATLRRMAAERAQRSDALTALGDILRGARRFKKAVEAYDAAIARVGPIEQRHWALLYSRGIALERSGQWQRAEADFIAALKLNPDQPYVLNYLGYSWVDRKINLNRARRMIERAVALRPNDGYIVDSLGWVLYRIKEFGGAVANLERAVELRPQDPTINDHLGDAYWRVGRRVEARYQWRRSLSLDPEPEQIARIREKIENGLATPTPEPPKKRPKTR